MHTPTPDDATAAPDWNTNEGKKAIVRKLVKHFKANPQDREKCLDQQYGTEMTKKLTGVKIPEGAKVVFLPQDDNYRGEEDPALAGRAAGSDARMGGRIKYNAGSSLIITLPPDDVTDETMLHYACSYVIW
jgi:hypothetical protein